MLHQVQQTVTPSMSLKKAIETWDQITRSLAESPRQRKSQISKYIFS